MIGANQKATFTTCVDTVVVLEIQRYSDYFCTFSNHKRVAQLYSRQHLTNHFSTETEWWVPGNPRITFAYSAVVSFTILFSVLVYFLSNTICYESESRTLIKLYCILYLTPIEYNLRLRLGHSRFVTSDVFNLLPLPIII